MLVCVMCVLMLCSLAGCGNNTGTANDNLNDATSGENYDGNGENGNNTGNAGPDAMEGKPVGEVYIGIAYEDVVVYKLNLEGSRKEIALKAIDFAQKKVIEKILKK